MKGQQSGRMTIGFDRPNAGHHFVARLDEGRAISYRQTDFDVELAVEFARLAHILAFLPEIESAGAESVPGPGEHRLVTFRQAADVVRVPVGDDDHINILWLVTGLRQTRRQIAPRPAAPEALT